MKRRVAQASPCVRIMMLDWAVQAQGFCITHNFTTDEVLSCRKGCGDFEGVFA